MTSPVEDTYLIKPTSIIKPLRISKAIEASVSLIHLMLSIKIHKAPVYLAKQSLKGLELSKIKKHRFPNKIFT